METSLQDLKKSQPMMVNMNMPGDRALIYGGIDITPVETMMNHSTTTIFFGTKF